MPSDELARCDTEIAEMVAAMPTSGDPIGPLRGELDWLVEKQLIEEAEAR